MITRIERISPLQAAKVVSVMYFILGATMAGFMLVFGLLFQKISASELLLTLGLPFLYAGLAFVFVPAACWLYNTIVSFTGGIEVDLEGTGVEE